MLSDSLFEVRQKLLKALSNYSTDPFEVDYPNSQKQNITLAIYHLRLAQMAYDSFEYPDDHEFNKKDKYNTMKGAKKEFYNATHKIDSDTD